jgi:hypothetical protein
MFKISPLVEAGQPWATPSPGSQGSRRPPLAGATECFQLVHACRPSLTEDMMSGTPATACHSLCLTRREGNKAHHTAHRLVLNTCCTGPGHSHQGSSATPVQVARPAVDMSHIIVQQAATEYTAAMFALVATPPPAPSTTGMCLKHKVWLQPHQPCSDRPTTRPRPALSVTGLGSPLSRPHSRLPLIKETHESHHHTCGWCHQ